MKRNHRLSWLFVFAGLLLLAGMACQLGQTLEATPTPAPPPPTAEPETVSTAVPPPTAVPEPTAEPAPEPATITIEQLQAATVQIFAQFEVNGRLQTQWTGSGAIITPDGLILTNAHVAAPLSPGLAILYNDPEFLFGAAPDALVVALVEQADAPPVETYLAEVAAADGTLDLAVIRIVSALDGTTINSASLDLPYVELGNSDDIRLGDEVRVLGFPGA
ncbi:MAG: trypsin-like peptidase domain-containing protein, partial [Anaerolineae bacterium]